MAKKTKLNSIPNFPEPLEPRLLMARDSGVTPAMIRHAYGFDQITFNVGRRTVAGDGSGQTIAIVDSFDAPTIVNDVRVFDRAFGISNFDGNGKPFLTIAHPGGKPPVDANWALEVSLDVEWAHAIAPKAHILLVEAASDTTDDLLAAIDYARHQSGVVAISLSWGGDESPFEKNYDTVLTTPRGHIGGSGLPGGIVYVTASGDRGAPASWPASSPNVIAVGGTTLTLDSAGNRVDEIAWSGSGGGPSRIERTYSPDVAYDADPNTAFEVYDSTPADRISGWQVIGGTSAGAPQWSALFAIADQGLALQGHGSLDGPRDAIRGIYALPQSDFNDIVAGSNGFPAGPGYDLVTGRGTPFADRIVRDLDFLFV